MMFKRALWDPEIEPTMTMPEPAGFPTPRGVRANQCNEDGFKEKIHLLWIQTRQCFDPLRGPLSRDHECLPLRTDDWKYFRNDWPPSLLHDDCPRERPNRWSLFKSRLRTGDTRLAWTRCGYTVYSFVLFRQSYASIWRFCKIKRPGGSIKILAT